MNLLELKYTLEGKLKRLHLHINDNITKQQKQKLLRLTGASKNGSDLYTYPTNPILVYNIRNIIDTSLCPQCAEWVTIYESKLKKLRAIKKCNTPEPQLVTNKLYDYQKFDTKFQLEAKKALNAGSMGVGKTPTSIAVANELMHSDFKCLVVASRSLLYMWEDEIKDWSVGNPKVVVAEGRNPQKRRESLNVRSNFYLVNYAMLRSPQKYPSLFKREWDLIIADEAHALKNRKSQQRVGFSKLKSKRLSLLTGTPVLNSPKELWSLLNILAPRIFGSYWQFLDMFCETKDNYYSPEPDIIGLKNKKALYFILDTLMVRRSKSEVLPDLPDKQFKTIRVNLNPQQRKLYDELAEEMFTILSNDKMLLASNKLTEIIRLRQLTLSPQIFGDTTAGVKTEVIQSLVDDTDQKIVIFSYSRKYIDLLENKLNTSLVKITGDVTGENRRKAETDFQSKDDIQVCLCTYQAASQGLNLQSSSIMILADKPWNPKTMEQAQDRIDRPGQTDNPLIISLIAEDTIDERIEEILYNKSKLIEGTIDSDSIN